MSEAVFHGPWRLFECSYLKSLTTVANKSGQNGADERFRQASGLAKEEEENQINTLIYARRDQADDILNSFKLSTTQLKQYHTDPVKTKFDEHFVACGNVIFERAKFNQSH